MQLRSGRIITPVNASAVAAGRAAKRVRARTETMKARTRASNLATVAQITREKSIRSTAARADMVQARDERLTMVRGRANREQVETTYRSSPAVLNSAAPAPADEPYLDFMRPHGLPADSLARPCRGDMIEIRLIILHMADIYSYGLAVDFLASATSQAGVDTGFAMIRGYSLLTVPHPDRPMAGFEALRNHNKLSMSSLIRVIYTIDMCDTFARRLTSWLYARDRAHSRIASCALPHVLTRLLPPGASMFDHFPHIFKQIAPTRLGVLSRAATAGFAQREWTAFLIDKCGYTDLQRLQAIDGTGFPFDCCLVLVAGIKFTHMLMVRLIDELPITTLMVLPRCSIRLTKSHCAFLHGKLAKQSDDHLSLEFVQEAMRMPLAHFMMSIGDLHVKYLTACSTGMADRLVDKRNNDGHTLLYLMTRGELELNALTAQHVRELGVDLHDVDGKGHNIAQVIAQSRRVSANHVLSYAMEELEIPLAMFEAPLCNDCGGGTVHQCPFAENGRRTVREVLTDRFAANRLRNGLEFIGQPRVAYLRNGRS